MTKVPRPFDKERIVSSTNDAKKRKIVTCRRVNLNPYCTEHTKQLKMDQRPKSKSQKAIKHLEKTQAKYA